MVTENANTKTGNHEIEPYWSHYISEGKYIYIKDFSNFYFQETIVPSFGLNKHISFHNTLKKDKTRESATMLYADSFLF